MSIFHIPSPIELSAIRDSNHKASVYASFLKPEPLWEALINEPSIVRGQMVFTFSGGNGVNFAAIEEDMPVYVSMNPLQNDIGILRIRNITSSDGGLTGTLVVARNTVKFVDGAYLTFVNDHPLFPKYPLIVGDPEDADFRKDTNITYSDQNDNLYPVVLAGPHKADIIDPSTGFLDIDIDMSDSYAMTPGATITTYGATAIPNAGVSITLNTSTGLGNLRFIASGQYWVKYTVTDSNGRTQKSYRFYAVHSSDSYSVSPKFDTNAPSVNLSVANISGDWEKGGWNTTIDVFDNGSLTDIPDNTLCIIWAQAYYGSQVGVRYLTYDKNLMVGYVKKHTINTRLPNNIQTTSFDVVSIEAVLANHYMYSVSLEAKNTTPTAWFEFRNELTCGRGVHHFWKWHSTLLEICDVVGLNRDTDMLRPYVEIEDGNLYSMPDDLLRNKGIRHHVVCDQVGRIHISPEIQLLTDNERSSLPIIQNIEYLDERDDFTIVREPQNRVVFVRTSGFSWDGSFVTTPSDECPEPPCPNPSALCSSAPTDVPADDGPTIEDFDRQTLRDQDHCDQLAGRIFAARNNLYPEFRIKLHGNYFRYFDVAYAAMWTTTIQATENRREIVWNNQKLICKSVSANISSSTGVINCDVVFEPEAQGEDGVAGICLGDLPTEDSTTGDITPQTSYGRAIVTGASVELKPTNSLWDLRLTDDVFDLIQDPFWRITQNSFNYEDAILIVGGFGFIKRTVDAGNTWVDITPTIDPPNIASDSPAPTVNDLEYVVLDGSQPNAGEFAILARWQNNLGLWRGWILFTLDNFATYSWDYLGTGGGSGLAIVDTDTTSFGSGPQIGYGWIHMRDDIYVNLTHNTDAGAILELWNITGDTFTYLDYIDVYIGGVYNPSDPTQYLNCGVALNDEKLLIVCNEVIDVFNNYSQLRYFIYDTAGDILTYVMDQPYAFTNSQVKAKVILNVQNPIPDNYILAYAYEKLDGVSYDKGLFGEVLLVNSSANIISTISVAGFVNDPPPNNDHYLLGMCPIHDSNYTVVTYVKYNGVDYDLYGVVWDVSTSLVHTEFLLQSGLVYSSYFQKLSQWKTVQDDIDLEQFLVCFKNASDELTILPVAHTNPSHVLTPGTPITRSDIVADITMSNMTGGKFIVTYSYQHTILGIDYVASKLFTVTLASGVLTDNADDLTLQDSYPLTSGTPHFQDTITNYYCGADIILVFVCLVNAGGALTNENRVLITNAVSEVKPLGVAISKGGGNYCYVTKYINNKLAIDTYNLPSLALINQSDIQVAVNLTDVDDKLTWFFPYVKYGDEDICYIFGRGYNPISQVMTYNSTSSVFTSFISGWGTDRCDSFLYDYADNYCAIRSTGLVSKLLYNGVLKLTLPFSGGVNPHSMKFGYYNELYICVDNPEPITVIRVPHPYTSYGNITLNHEVDEGVWAIEVL